MPEPVDLEPDELVADLQSRVGAEADLIVIVGFVGEASGENAGERARVYSDKTLLRWVEIERSAIHRREQITREEDGQVPMSKLWVEVAALLEEFSGRPDKLSMDFLNDRAELFFEPPANLLEAVSYLKMAPVAYAYALTAPSRRPRYHC